MEAVVRQARFRETRKRIFAEYEGRGAGLAGDAGFLIWTPILPAGVATGDALSGIRSSAAEKHGVPPVFGRKFRGSMQHSLLQQ